MKIYIDAGHNYNGRDIGARCNGVWERNINVKIAAALKPLLIKQGHEVRLNREKLTDSIGGPDINASLQARCDDANQWGADLFISIHCNAFDLAARGTETYCYKLKNNNKETEAAKLAKAVQKNIVNDLGTLNRGTKEANFKVLTGTNMPAILVECAFIDFPQDREKLLSRDQDFAKAIYKGVLEYTGEIEKVEEKEMENKKENNIPWYNDAQWFVKQAGISDGTRPDDTATRAEVWQMIYKLALYIEKQK